MGCSGSTTACTKFEAPEQDANEAPLRLPRDSQPASEPHSPPGEAPSLLRSLAGPGSRMANGGLAKGDCLKKTPASAWNEPPTVLQQVAPAAGQQYIGAPPDYSRWRRRVRKMRPGRV
eukprot:TRINITY_DN94473_c0_g1_i1.p1 TRINITY_DN94473_c0_g1~~TRINITY_DN94473_c0_g1_i1.p1  ORF type:complete len:127 (-),score=18.80 TRINITY_DN94473_c0_g1_i1:243-596(-)